MSRARALAVVTAAALLVAPVALALPPVETVIEQLDEARTRPGAVEVRGTLTWGPFTAEPVRLEVERGAAPRLRFAGQDVRADWTDPELDVVLRLLGAALAAPDLAEALRGMGRTLEESVQTLAFMPPQPSATAEESALVYVLGGPLGARAPRLYVARDTYLLLGVDFPAPEGVYELRASEHALGAGWFPAHLTVMRGERTLLELRLEAGE